MPRKLLLCLNKNGVMMIMVMNNEHPTNQPSLFNNPRTKLQVHMVNLLTHYMSRQPTTFKKEHRLKYM